MRRLRHVASGLASDPRWLAPGLEIGLDLDGPTQIDVYVRAVGGRAGVVAITPARHRELVSAPFFEQAEARPTYLSSGRRLLMLTRTWLADRDTSQGTVRRADPRLPPSGGRFM